MANRVEAGAISDISQLKKTANVYILAISDDGLYNLALDLHLDNALVLHTSGATPIDVLKHVSSRYGVLWSPQSFVRDVALEYGELPFCIEGNTSQTEDDIEELISMISLHIHRTNFEQRQYLHLASVMVNNFTNGLYAMAQKVCQEHDAPFEVLYPLIMTTAKKVQWGDVRYQMTGPAVRHDEKTIAAHRKLLMRDRDVLDIYDAFTEIIKKMKGNS